MFRPISTGGNGLNMPSMYLSIHISPVIVSHSIQQMYANCYAHTRAHKKSIVESEVSCSSYEATTTAPGFDWDHQHLYGNASEALPRWHVMA